MERYIPVAKTRPKQPRVWLLFLKAGYKTAVLGTTILTNGEKHFGPTDRDNRTGQRGPPSKLVPNFPVGPNRHGPLHLKFPEFWVEWKAAYYFPLKLFFGLLKQTVPNPFPASRHQTFLQIMFSVTLSYISMKRLSCREGCLLVTFTRTYRIACET